jgi:DNA-binding CsgD family transcriptional regulator
MEHLLVFAFLAIFLCGSWVSFVSWRQYKATGILLFRSLFQYVISFDLLVFGFFVARYAHTNLVGDNPFNFSPAIWVGTSVGVFVLETSVTWTILRLAWNFKQNTFPRILTLSFLAAIILIGISYVIGITVMFQSGSPMWIVVTHQVLSVFMALGFGYAVIGLVAGRYTNLNAKQRKSARCFGWLLLGSCLIVPVSLVLPKSIYLVGFAVGLLWACCTPLLWLRRYAGPYQQPVTPEAASSALAALARRHGITHREQEVMALLVEGKSNKEIEDSLCISFSTVKNHVYNLYRKLEVNSRAQLLRLVMIESTRMEP